MPDVAGTGMGWLALAPKLQPPPNTRCGPAADSGVRALMLALLPPPFVLPIVRKGAGRGGH